jgi:hypothetical protein
MGVFLPINATLRVSPTPATSAADVTATRDDNIILMLISQILVFAVKTLLS